MIIKFNGVELADGPLQPIKDLNTKLDTVGYWINPVNWAKEAWEGIEKLVLSDVTGYWLMGATVIGIILMMLGANFPKKYVFWSWIVYWTLRGFVFI